MKRCVWTMSKQIWHSVQLNRINSPHLADRQRFTISIKRKSTNTRISWKTNTRTVPKLRSFANPRRCSWYNLWVSVSSMRSRNVIPFFILVCCVLPRAAWRTRRRTMTSSADQKQNQKVLHSRGVIQVAKPWDSNDNIVTGWETWRNVRTNPSTWSRPFAGRRVFKNSFSFCRVHSTKYLGKIENKLS
jgi:hypothetical protein